MKHALISLASLASIAVGACVETGPGPQGKKIDPTYVQAHLLSAVPTDIERFDVPLAGVTYLGNKVDKTRVPPGQPVTVTHYWKVDQPIGDRWRLFAQLRGAPNTADFMNLPPTDMQHGHGPKTWQAGEIIEDIQVIHLRPDWKSSEATLLVGLIEVGKHGTLDRMDVAGPRTRDRAIVAAKLEVDLARAPAPKGTVYISQAGGQITVDGIGSDPGWAGIAMTELVPAEGASGEPVGKANAKLTWNAEFLYVFASVSDTDITSPYKQHDDPLWKADCVELFIDADSNKQGYVELQVNPNNATFDSFFATTRAKPGDVKWDSGMVTAVKLRGSAEAGDSGDVGWDVEIAIPWAAVKGTAEDMKVRLPPEVGDRWRLNLVRVDRKTGGKDNDVWASSWNRITMSDFHALDRMLTAVFADRGGSIVPAAKDPGDEDAGSGSAAGSGSTAPKAGSAAPNAGSGTATPNAGSATPKAGSANAGSGTATPNAGSGSASPNAGSATPKAGSANANNNNSATPNTGSATPKASNTTPNSGSAAPNAGSGSAARKAGSGSAVLAPAR